MSKKSTAVEKRTSKLPAKNDLFEQDAGAGFENTDSDSYAIPYLTIVQKGSPQVDEDKAEFIPGAKPGMIINTVTQELFPEEEGVLVVPVHYNRVYNEWRPYDLGGGFRGVHQVDDPIIEEAERDESGRFVLPNGNHLSDTRNHFCLMIHENGSFEHVLISFASTQIKKSRTWMTKMNSLKMQGKDGLFTPPSYSQIYRLTGNRPESNDKGSWKGWMIEHLRAIDPDKQEEAAIYMEARSFRQAIVSGRVEVTPPVESSDGTNDKF